MRTVLEQETAGASQPEEPRPVRAMSTAAEEAQEQELDWEVASSHQEAMPEEIPGQERLTFE